MIEEMASDIVQRNFHRFREMVFEDASYFSTDMGRVKSRLYYNVAVYETGDTYFFIEIENLHRDRSHTYPNISSAVAQRPSAMPTTCSPTSARLAWNRATTSENQTRQTARRFYTNMDIQPFFTCSCGKSASLLGTESTRRA